MSIVRSAIPVLSKHFHCSIISSHTLDRGNMWTLSRWHFPQTAFGNANELCINISYRRQSCVTAALYYSMWHLCVSSATYENMLTYWSKVGQTTLTTSETTLITLSDLQTKKKKKKLFILRYLVASDHPGKSNIWHVWNLLITLLMSVSWYCFVYTLTFICVWSIKMSLMLIV